MARAVLDPGVLVAAALSPQGVCRRALQAAIADQYTLVCPVLLAELEEVLLRPKFRRWLPIEQARSFVALVANLGERLPDPRVEPGVTPDPDDDYLVALARQAGADVLVSGDPHLTGLVGAQPPVVTPRAFLDSVLGAERGEAK